MNDIKKVFNYSFITTAVVFVCGLIFMNKFILIGMLNGCIISILGLYILSMDVRNIVYVKNDKMARKIAVLGFLKRYTLYMVFLGILIYFLGFKYFIAGAVGLFNVRFNIYVSVLQEKFKKFEEKNL